MAGVMAFVKAECVNHLPDGGCLGATVDKSGVTYASMPRATCLVAVRCRCAYFEKSVLPTSLDQPHMNRVSAEYFRYADRAAEDGHPFALDPTAARGNARYCDCGAPLSARKRYCPDCLRKRRKAAWREEKQRQREATPI